MPRRRKTPEPSVKWRRPASEEEYLAQVRNKLTESGVTSEVAVAQEAAGAGWEVSLSSWYVDPNTKKPREIDAVAVREDLVGLKGPPLAGSKDGKPHTDLARASISLVVEVKSADVPWAVLPSTTATWLPNIPGYADVYLVSSHIGRGSSVPFDEGFEETIHAKSDYVASGLREVLHRGSRAAFKGMLACMSAARSFWQAAETKRGTTPEQLLRSLDEAPEYDTWHPVLIHGGDLFRVGFGNPLSLTKVPWAPVALGWTSAGTDNDRLLVDVVTMAAWSDYLALMSRRASVIFANHKRRGEHFAKTKKMKVVPFGQLHDD